MMTFANFCTISYNNDVFTIRITERTVTVLSDVESKIFRFAIQQNRRVQFWITEDMVWKRKP